MAYMKDSTGRRLDDFVVSSASFGEYDASDLTAADGSLVATLPDLSGKGNDFIQFTAASQPTLRTAGPNGNRYIEFTGSDYMLRDTLGNGWNQPAGYPQPNTIVMVTRGKSSTGTTTQNLLSGLVPGGRHNIYANSGTASIMLQAAASSTAIGGPKFNDDAWHVWVFVFGTADYAIYRDGYIVAAGASQAQGAEPFSRVRLGAAFDGTSPATFDLGELKFISGRIEPQRLDDLVAGLAAKWGVSDVGTNANPADGSFLSTTSADTTNIRVWLPRTAPTKWVIWSHPHAHNEQIIPGTAYWPLINAAVNEGWGVVASRQAGDSWGNDASLNATLSARDYIATNYGAPTDVVMVGGSMGGLPSLLAALGQTVTIPNIRGVYLLDGVTNLSNMFAANAGTYSESIRSAYGIAADGSDYAAKTANHDPNLRAASAFPAIRYRFVASAADTAVNKVDNSDSLNALLATRSPAVQETSVVTKLGGHLSAVNIDPADLAGFLNRCA